MKHSKNTVSLIAVSILTAMICVTSIGSDAATLKTTAAASPDPIVIEPVLTAETPTVRQNQTEQVIETKQTIVTKTTTASVKTTAKKPLLRDIVVTTESDDTVMTETQQEEPMTKSDVIEPVKSSDLIPYYDITKNDLEILYRITEAEATNGTIEQKMNVVSCIFARYESNEWPNTIEGVVFQKSQFSPISDGRYYTVKITDETKEAVDYIVMNGKQHNYIFFCSYGCKSKWFASKDAALAAKGEEPYRDGIHRYYLE